MNFTFSELELLRADIEVAQQRLLADRDAVLNNHGHSGLLVRLRNPRYTTVMGFLGLIRKIWFAEFSLELVKTIQQNGFSGLDPGQLPEPGGFLDFLEDELSQNEACVSYVEKTPFDPQTRARLLLSLGLQNRFFVMLVKQVREAP